ncbi:hypothetical protein [Chitinophaga sp. YIM B06452]|uniref:hypothetical protein n=1 Tax=Chitinophaga sp. YIM B06452 TaxID=3082158 RepID=UPI0031FE5823
MGSFYDFDYIIELNEKRIEQYSNAYHRYVEKFTVLLVIYSAFAIFLIPIIQSLFFMDDECHWLHHVAFYLFITFLLCSIFFTIRLLIPVDVVYLSEPRIYYEVYKGKYEEEGNDHANTDSRLKAGYIYELESVVSRNNVIYKRKSRFYSWAFSFAIFATLPYLVCLGFHVKRAKDHKQPISIIEKITNFSEM